jgi:phenylacetate-CoA ligase
MDYFQAMDHARITAEHPVGDAFLDFARRISRDELRSRQEALFARSLAFAWKVPFYLRLWGAQGIEPGDIRGLDDLPRLPTYSKTDLMQSVASFPPLGDFHGLDSYPPDQRPPVIFQTTSGTTGRPQPLLFGPRSREIQNLLLARVWQFQGLTPDDRIHSVYGHGMINGGHYVREAALHWTRSLFLSAGTGVETRSATQVELMRDFGVTVVVGFADYIKRLAETARSMGLEPGRDLPVRMISGHLGAESRAAISAAWGGAQVFDWYGVGDTGLIAGEGPDQDGFYVMEDAQYLELVDPDSGRLVDPGGRGNMVCTCLYKDDVFPIIRFNTCDLSEWVDTPSSLGLNFRRIRGFLGRSDNMVKLRGINVFPAGIGVILSEHPAGGGDYICTVSRVGERDEMTVAVEVTGDQAGLAEALADLLRRRLGVEVVIELCEPGSLATLTGLETRQKPIRLIDRRPKA